MKEWFCFVLSVFVFTAIFLVPFLIASLPFFLVKWFPTHEWLWMPGLIPLILLLITVEYWWHKDNHS